MYTIKVLQRNLTVERTIQFLPTNRPPLSPGNRSRSRSRKNQLSDKSSYFINNHFLELPQKPAKPPAAPASRPRSAIRPTTNKKTSATRRSHRAPALHEQRQKGNFSETRLSKNTAPELCGHTFFGSASRRRLPPVFRPPPAELSFSQRKLGNREGR